MQITVIQSEIKKSTNDGRFAFGKGKVHNSEVWEDFMGRWGTVGRKFELSTGM
jgi:hypothetical protein